MIITSNKYYAKSNQYPSYIKIKLRKGFKKISLLDGLNKFYYLKSVLFEWISKDYLFTFSISISDFT